MKLLFILATLLATSSIFGQNVTINISINGSIPDSGAFIFFPLTNDTILVSGKSAIIFDTSIYGRRVFYCCKNDRKSRIWNINDTPLSAAFINFILPDQIY